MTGHRAFRLLSEGDLAALDRAARVRLESWCRDWFASFEPSELALTVEASHGPVPGEWLKFEAGENLWFAWNLSESPWRALSRQIFGGDPGPSAAPSPLTEAVLRDCIHECAARLLPSKGGESGKSAGIRCDGAQLVHAYGDGSASVRLGGALSGQSIRLGGALVEYLIRESKAAGSRAAVLAKRDGGIGKGRVCLEVSIGSAELSLAQLASMAPGDVLRLNTQYREPVAIRLEDGKPLGRGFLAKREGRRVLQLTS